jgi:hypothetical protein
MLEFCQEINGNVLRALDNELWRVGIYETPQFFYGLEFEVICGVVPVLIAAWWLAHGVPRFITARLATRTQVAAVGGVLYLLANIQPAFYGIKLLLWHVLPWITLGPNHDYWSRSTLGEICLLALMIWLTPRRVKTQALVLAA